MEETGKLYFIIHCMFSLLNHLTCDVYTREYICSTISMSDYVGVQRKMASMLPNLSLIINKLLRKCVVDEANYYY